GGLATALSDRGVAYGSLGKYTQAVADHDKAVDILTRLVEKEGHTELADDLARSLTSRGVAYGSLSKYAQAVADLDKAVDILTRLVEKEGHTELADDLARSLIGRGVVRLNQNKESAPAIADLEKARRVAADRGLKEAAKHLLPKASEL